MFTNYLHKYKNMKIICIKCLYLYLFSCVHTQATNEDAAIVKSKNPLPYFRRQVEELTENTTIQTTLSEDIQNNFVSFLIKNVKKIYNELDEVRQVENSTSVWTSTKDHVFVGTSAEVTKAFIFGNNFYLNVTNHDKETNHDIETSIPTDVTTLLDVNKTYSNDLSIYKNVTLLHFSKEIIDVELSTTACEITDKEELTNLANDLITYVTDRKQRDNEMHRFIASENVSLEDNNTNELVTIRQKSCVVCNNVALEACSDPKNRLVPSMICERSDDLCYTQHTPFGVVDRGCFNENHNLTTYVCSCNLCNYVSIGEMPNIFSKKREWADNVVELSRTRHFTKSVFKGRTCLRCESNETAKVGNMLDTTNCLEGNIGALPTEECGENEVCAVKAIKNDGYVWRGCVRYPLYNYWWNLCDTDLCNYDAALSVYDLE